MQLIVHSASSIGTLPNEILALSSASRFRLLMVYPRSFHGLRLANGEGLGEYDAAPQDGTGLLA